MLTHNGQNTGQRNAIALATSDHTGCTFTTITHGEVATNGIPGAVSLICGG